MKNFIKTTLPALAMLSLAACSHKKTNNTPDSTSTTVTINSTVKTSSVIDPTKKLDSLRKKIDSIKKADSIKNSIKPGRTRRHTKGDGADTSLRSVIREYKRDSISLHR